MQRLHGEDVVRAIAGHDGRRANLGRRADRRAICGPQPHQPRKGLVVGRHRVGAIESENFVTVDTVWREARLGKCAFHIRPFPRQIGKTFVDQR
jgi:hypothetical protein